MPLKKQIIPPTRLNVKAGFCVYSPNEDERQIIILNEGVLAAVDKSEGNKRIVFKMYPGDLVGVAALLEREPFRYTIEALEDSKITKVSEECMESELQTLPVWLLAVIKNLTLKTKSLKHSLKQARTPNTLKSLASFLSHKEENAEFFVNDLVHEFRWQTKITSEQILLDFKSLARRRLIELIKKENQFFAVIKSTFLLKIFVDYKNSEEKELRFRPFHLSQNEKRILKKLATLDESMQKTAPEWIDFLQEISVAEWIRMVHENWFVECETDLYQINLKHIKYLLTAILYEANIKGTI